MLERHCRTSPAVPVNPMSIIGRMIFWLKMPSQPILLWIQPSFRMKTIISMGASTNVGMVDNATVVLTMM